MAIPFKDPNRVLDQINEMDEATRRSFYEALERISTNYDPGSGEDENILPLREPDYVESYTVTFDDGILAFMGPTKMPPLVWITLIDVVWLDEWIGDDEGNEG